MILTAKVKIWGAYVGAIAWDERNQLGSFEYAPDFLNKAWDLSPIKMPIDRGRQVFSFPELRPGRGDVYDTFKGLPGLIADMLPDKYGNQLIDAWLVRQGRPSGSMNPIEKLCFIGSRGMGALEFEPSSQSTQNTAKKIEVSSLVDISRKMLDQRLNFAADLSTGEEKAMTDILRVGTSAGGARPKAVIAFNPKTGEIKSGQTKAPQGFEHWLIKLDGVSDAQFGESSGYGRVEMAYHLMAKRAGIDMMDCQLLEENGRAHFMTKRYDRADSNTRHHVQTWCAMNHYDFNDMASFSYELLFETMRALHLSYPMAEQMYRRMVFNVLSKNCDDHTKNFSFKLEKGGEWELSPAYDICYAYDPKSIWVSQHALSINGKRKAHQLEDFLTIAKSMNIKKGKSLVEEIANVVGKWEEFANEAGVSKDLMRRVKDKLPKIL
jgi:serine/threonine-protein kinase HipA